jgi:hypothetical protein
VALASTETMRVVGSQPRSKCDAFDEGVLARAPRAGRTTRASLSINPYAGSRRQSTPVCLILFPNRWNCARRESRPRRRTS